MFGKIAIIPRAVDDLTRVVGQRPVDRLRRLAEPLQGKQVLHLSSPAASSALRSLLQSAVPLLADLGLNIQWQQLRLPAEYADTDVHLRRALSGMPSQWSEQHEARWRELNESNAQLFDEQFDAVVVHHTASVGILAALEAAKGAPDRGRWVWHSHRDYHDAVPEVWRLIHKHVGSFDVGAYDYREFIRNDAPARRNVVISPGVDPLGPSTQPLSAEARRTLLSQRGVDLGRPILALIVFSMREEQPARAIDTYELVKARHPEVQLIVVNMVTREGPALHHYLEVMGSRAASLGDMVVLTERDRVGHTELAALREEATALIHQGMPRGISMELLEEMWQGRPIVSSRSPVAVALIANGETGLLADTEEEQAKAIVHLLEHPDDAARMGKAAHAAVRRGHLVTHHLAGYLQLLQRLLTYADSPSTSKTRK